MATYNIRTTYKRGEVGKVIGFTCRAADASTGTVAAVDLTNYTVTFNVWQGTTLVIDNAACTKRTQSGSTLGQCYHTLDATTANIAKGDYRFELKATYGSNVLYFPTNEDGARTYGYLFVQEPRNAAA
jgi:hypothetical protein